MASPLDADSTTIGRTPDVACAVAIAIGASALVGWTFNNTTFKSVVPGLVAMQPVTAICLVLSGTAILFARYYSRSSVINVGSGSAVLLLSILNLAQYIFEIDLRIDDLFFSEAVRDQTVAMAHRGRMAEPTAIAFTLIAASIVLVRARSAAMARLSAGCATAVAVLVIAILLGYLFQAGHLTMIFDFSFVALNTAVGLGALSVGLLALRPDVGWISLLRGSGVGASAARRLLPLVIVVPVAVGWLALKGSQAGLYPAEVRLALITTVTLVLLVSLTIWAATRLNNLDSIRRTEQALRQTERRLDAVLNNASVAIFTMDERQHCSYMNAAAERLTGYTFAETAGRPLHDVIHHTRPDGSHFPLEDCAIDRAFPANHQEHGEETFVRPDGSFYPVSFTASPLHDDQSSTVGTIVEVRDLTEEKALQAQLRHVQRMDAVGQLTGGIAHDFNNILSIIVGNMDLLSEQANESSEAALIANETLGAATRGAELVRRLLAFARKQNLNPVALDLNERLPEMDPLLRRSLRENIRLDVHSAPGLWSARVDPGQVDDALVNLAINARDAMPEGGALTIETGNVVLDEDYAVNHAEVSPGQYVMLAVSDTGKGMAPEVIARAFEPFYTTKPEGQGTGLGLSQVYGWIKQSGGHVEIYSELGHGTTIRLYLPRADATESGKEVLAEEGAVLRGSERVLVVEDNPNVRSTVVRQLKSLGYSTIEAEDARSALEMVKAGVEFDLLFTDVVMPGGMTGYDLAEQVQDLRPDLRVLFTSGYTELFVGSGSGNRLGQLISKPYRKSELARVVRDILDKGG